MPTSRSDREIDLWRRWKSSPGPETLEPLLDSLAKPLIYPIANRVGTGIGGGRLRIPRPVVHGIAINKAVAMMKEYSPESSKLSTYINNYLIGHIQGPLNKYRDIVRIPYGKVEDVGKVKETEAALWETLGRYPSDAEVSAKLRLPEKHIRSIREQTSQKDYIASQTEMHTGLGDSPWDWAARRTYTELPVQDKALWDLWSKEDKSVNEIMQSMNLSRREVERGLERLRAQFVDNLSSRTEDAGAV